jgi:hypothetical protein
MSVVFTEVFVFLFMALSVSTGEAFVEGVLVQAIVIFIIVKKIIIPQFLKMFSINYYLQIRIKSEFRVNAKSGY